MDYVRAIVKLNYFPEFTHFSRSLAKTLLNISAILKILKTFKGIENFNFVKCVGKTLEFF